MGADTKIQWCEALHKKPLSAHKPAHLHKNPKPN